MSGSSGLADAGDFDRLTLLIAAAERAAKELAKLRADRRRLGGLCEQAFSEFNREIDAGNLPVVKLAELTTLHQDLSKIEAELAAVLALLAEGLN